MRLKLILFVSILLIGAKYSNAQTATDTVHLVPEKAMIGKYISNSGSTYFSASVYAIGKFFPLVGINDTTELISRSYFKFDLSSIPPNADIIDVLVKRTAGGGYSYNMKITGIDSISGTYDSTNWNSIGNGTALITGLSYQGQAFYSTVIVNYLNNSLPVRQAILGAASENETANDSYSSFDITLDVIYTRPATQLNLFAQNDLDGAAGGDIGIGVNNPATIHPSPYNFQAFEQQQINLKAYDNQYINGSTWTFNDNEAPLTKSKWDKSIGQTRTKITDNSSTSLSAVTSLNNGIFIAYLKKYVRPTFQNNFLGVGNSGTIKINGIQIASPSAQDTVIEGNAITVTALYQNINHISYYFTNWSTGSTNPTETFYPDANATITANFEGLPAEDMGVWFEASNPRAPITIHWNEYPNPNVTQYQIWRKAKYQKGPTSPPQLIATVNRGTTSYVDGEYSGTRAGFTDWMLWYDVKPYYSIEGTYAPDSYKTVFSGGMLAKGLGEMAITENKIENYPNPFNPETIIRYQITKSGPVSIRVYDITGKEIMTLVNEEKSRGRYEVKFDASRLASGIYFYRITANGFNAIKKMILMK